MTVNIKELSDAIFYLHKDITRKAAEESVRSLFSSITLAVLEGEEVFIPEFGRFTRVDKPARKAHNPKTLEVVDVGPYSKMVFTPSKNLRKFTFTSS